MKRKKKTNKSLFGPQKEKSCYFSFAQVHTMGRKQMKANGKGPIKKRRQVTATESESDEHTNVTTRPPKKRAHRVEAEEVRNLEPSSDEEVDVTTETVVLEMVSSCRNE
jgi:hypothetical protein